MTSSRRGFLRDTALLMAALPLAAACSRTDTATERSGGGALDRARRQGYIQVGFANEAPYGYTDTSGKLTGEAPELARVLFGELGIKDVRGVQLDFGGLIGGLQARRFDVIAAGMFITPERCAQVAFSDPEYVAKSAFLVPKGNPDGIRRFEDVARSGLRLGVLSGAVEGTYAEKLGVRKGDIKTFADQPSAFEGLDADRVDAVALTRISLADLLGKHKGAPFEITEPYVPVIGGKEQFGAGGFAFRKQDSDLLAAVNGKLAELKKGDRLLPIIKPFGFTEAELPGDHTAAVLCKA
ncbi:ectoine/hydroxyectoine ABC transporter substrate-binding protein EhuB [Actinomadura sp. HBU206391]|uniref:ectoine/hydroxyectoine ABC transporter substrate-binding protein EhuB n=1 Tax=Actinomadura sp. HBU206391 TaxID=2731692 RepID=UPI0016506894|nr:ectoine/hydroxyectoine ABC transporter substrate-binding protein EhuB [Actinomadura sp. HBU206391]MBC6460497.1 ectoine/hydroxyectoine ABC transporter substrate-binding protein EhuB [Actinomadura sp. HBU206391]